MTFTTGDRVQAIAEFQRWWAAQVAGSPNPAAAEYYAQAAAGAAWLAACEWCDGLRGDE